MKDNSTVDRVKRALLSMQRHSWEQGVAMQAFMESGDAQIVHCLGKEAVHRSMEDGRVATIGVMDAVTDSCAAGEALLWIAKNTEDKAIKEGVDKLLDWAIHKAPRNKDGVLYHLIDKPQFWVDSMYMLPPFLAAAGEIEEACLNLNGYWNTLFDEKSGLMCHMWEDEQKEYVRRAHWGVGNGWAIAGLARVIDILEPFREWSKEREIFIRRVRLLIENILQYRRNDGLFHDVIDDEVTFIETNLSQMLAYTIYKGIKGGWLPLELKKQGDICRDAVEKKVDELGFVQGVCASPTFDKAGIAPEGNAFYILMKSLDK